MTKEHARRYYHLVKPGIVYGNALHVVVGYMLAFHFGFNIVSFLGVLFGVSLVIASACVANNYMDRGIDAHMKRTKNRSLVTGVIESRDALIFSAVLGILGIVTLLMTTNILTVTLGLIAYVWYVWVYGYAKRTTYMSTLIGAVPGSLPLVAGYTAQSNTFDSVALLLFVMLFIWQLPHFYAIAIARRDEYASASIPIITAFKSDNAIRYHMLAWSSLYVVSVIALAVFGAINPIATFIWLAVAAVWLWHMVRAYPMPTTQKWAKKSFRLSLLMPICLIIVAAITVVLA